MTSPLGVSGSCARGLCPSGWGSTLPWEAWCWQLWSHGSSALPCLQHSSSWKGDDVVGVLPGLLQVVLMPKKFCISVKISLCLFGNWCGFWRLLNWLWCSSMCPFNQSDKPQAVQQHHEPGSCLELCVVLSLNLHFSGLFFLQTSFQVGFLTGKRMCSPTNINVILWLWV